MSSSAIACGRRARRQRALDRRRARRSGRGSSIAIHGCTLAVTGAEPISPGRPAAEDHAEQARRRRPRRRAGCAPGRRTSRPASGSVTHCGSTPSASRPRRARPRPRGHRALEELLLHPRARPARLAEHAPVLGTDDEQRVEAQPRPRRGDALDASASEANSASGVRASWSRTTAAPRAANTITPVSPRGHTEGLREPGPRRVVVEALGEGHADLARPAVRGAVLAPRDAAADVADGQLQRTADRRVRPVALAERVALAVHPGARAYGPADHDDRPGRRGRRHQPVQRERLAAGGLDRGQHDRQLAARRSPPSRR